VTAERGVILTVDNAIDFAALVIEAARMGGPPDVLDSWAPRPR